MDRNHLIVSCDERVTFCKKDVSDLVDLGDFIVLSFREVEREDMCPYCLAELTLRTVRTQHWRWEECNHPHIKATTVIVHPWTAGALRLHSARGAVVGLSHQETVFGFTLYEDANVPILEPQLLGKHLL